jgi:hypothetical protein
MRTTHQYLERVLVKKIALLLLTLVSSAALAEPVLLATTKLSPLIDADTLRINSCRADEAIRVSAIKVRAAKHTANLQSLEVQYGNLNNDLINIRQTLAPGQSTGWIDLEGRGRCVLSIRVVGSSGSILLKKAVIEVYGMRRERDMRDRREELPPARPMPPSGPRHDDRRDNRRDDRKDDRRDDRRDDRGQQRPGDRRDDRGPRR